MMTKSDIYVLGIIKKIDATNPLKSAPVATLSKNINLSHTKIRTALKILINDGYVSEGYMQKNARTYYITESGIEFINVLYSQNKNQED